LESHRSKFPGLAFRTCLRCKEKGSSRRRFCFSIEGVVGKFYEPFPRAPFIWEAKKDDFIIYIKESENGYKKGFSIFNNIQK
jgi:hypothetical protein